MPELDLKPVFVFVLKVPVLLAMWNQAAAEIVLLIRTYAFFNRNNYMLAFLVSALGGVIAFQLYVASSQMLRECHAVHSQPCTHTAPDSQSCRSYHLPYVSCVKAPPISLKNDLDRRSNREIHNGCQQPGAYMRASIVYLS